MSEVKHTPGPWANWGEDEVPEGIPVLEIARGECGTPECRQIAYVQPSMTDDDEFYLSDEDRANARLITSAPDLLEVLEESLPFIGYGQHVPDIIAKVEAAISKAKGDV